MSEQEAWTMVNKISGLIEERDSLRERVAFLVAEAHGWQPRLEAAEAEVARLRFAAESYIETIRNPLNGPPARQEAIDALAAALAAPTKEDT